MNTKEACQLILKQLPWREVFIFDMGKPVIDLARNMIRLAGFIPDKEIEIQVVGLRPGRT
jgi:FlaA1/EpsC-like NDP-sugar epimerase